MTYVEDISCVLKCCENTIMKIYYLSEDHPYIYAYREWGEQYFYLCEVLLRFVAFCKPCVVTWNMFLLLLLL